MTTYCCINAINLNVATRYGERIHTHHGNVNTWLLKGTSILKTFWSISRSNKEKTQMKDSFKMAHLFHCRFENCLFSVMISGTLAVQNSIKCPSLPVAYTTFRYICRHSCCLRNSIKEATSNCPAAVTLSGVFCKQTH